MLLGIILLLVCIILQFLFLCHLRDLVTSLRVVSAFVYICDGVVQEIICMFTVFFICNYCVLS